MPEILQGMCQVQISLHDGWSAGVKVQMEGDKEKSGLRWKKVRVEVELELESDGSREDRWRVRGLQAIAFGLLGLKELDRERNELLREQNELWREQNSYLHRIAEWLESGLGPKEIEVLVEDSTIRE